MGLIAGEISCFILYKCSTYALLRSCSIAKNFFKTKLSDFTKENEDGHTSPKTYKKNLSRPAFDDSFPTFLVAAPVDYSSSIGSGKIDITAKR